MIRTQFTAQKPAKRAADIIVPPPAATTLPAASDWTFETIDQYHEVIKATAEGRFGLDGWPVTLLIITAEQMMDAYASIGMPVYYNHWSFGKNFVATERQYRRGQMGLAYEIVINSSPCIAYLMEENTMAMQALVIAHAAYGHNSFFKGNYLFRQWTEADGIVDYLVYARNFIRTCEEKHGVDAVEEVLDSCHALSNYGVDRYKRRHQKLSLVDEERRRKEREAYAQSRVDELWRVVAPDHGVRATDSSLEKFPKEPEENLLYFIEKNAPTLESWKREVIRIVRKIAQYFYPQRQTQVMNEGWATFWHHQIMNTMYDDGHLADGIMTEFMISHTNVIYQPPVESKYYSGINPYALGFAMYTDIKRICEGGTWRGVEFIPSTVEQLAEDREWFPDIAGSDWLETLDHAMRSFKDESFVEQYLSPRLMREFRLFKIIDDEKAPTIVVGAIHDEGGYREVRAALSRQYNLSSREPDIQVCSVDTRGDRSLTLRHAMHSHRPLNAESTEEVLKHVARLWEFDARLESVEDDVVAKRFEAKAPGKKK